MLQKSLTLGSLAGFCAGALLFTLPGSFLPSLAALGLATLASPAQASDTLEARKLPMRFTWHDQRWVTAVGVITGDTPREFAEFADGRDLKGTTIVLDSSGGSVLDAIKLGRQWRDLGATTTVGIMTEVPTANGSKFSIFPDGYCESMCVFLLLSGTSRYVPEGAHVRVHQIWMGDRADDARAASYTAQDVMIIERDVGRLAKYAIDMGGTGDLLALALSIPPWESLHELTRSELRSSNLVTDDAIDRVASGSVSSSDKPVQDRVAASTSVPDEKQNSSNPNLLDPNLSSPAFLKQTKTAEAGAPTGTAPQH